MDFSANKSLKKKLTKAEFRCKVEGIMASLQQLARPLTDDPQEKKERIERAKHDPFYFFRTYLPHYFNLPFAPFHYDLVSMLERKPAENQVVRPVVVVAPREFAKTTITSFGYVLHQICFELRKFIIIISDTADLASDLTGYIYLELCFNDRIKQDFGLLVRENWAVDDYVTLNDIRLKARGRGQRIRGTKHKQYRPDLIILDDLENESSSKNPLRVKDLLTWVSSAVYSAIDAGGNLFIVGTLLSKKSALQAMISSKEAPWSYWERKVYRAITPDNDSLWPAKFPRDMLEEQKKMMGTVAFSREKLNLPIDDEGLFKPEWMTYYHPTELPDNLIIGGWFDPSIESGMKSDYKAIITVGLDPDSMIYYVLDAYIRKTSLDNAIQRIYQLHAARPFLVFGVETNLFQKLLLKEFDYANIKYGLILPVKGVVNHLAKETRISGLSPLVERHQIKFDLNQGDQKLLEEQLLYFPSTHSHDDGPDALEGAVRLMQYSAIKPIELSSEPDFHTYRIKRNMLWPLTRPQVLH